MRKQTDRQTLIDAVIWLLSCMFWISTVQQHRIRSPPRLPRSDNPFDLPKTGNMPRFINGLEEALTSCNAIATSQALPVFFTYMEHKERTLQQMLFQRQVYGKRISWKSSLRKRPALYVGLFYNLFPIQSAKRKLLLTKLLLSKLWFPKFHVYILAAFLAYSVFMKTILVWVFMAGSCWAVLGLRV